MRRIVFIAAMAGQPWGGSEELWSQSARRLHEEGEFAVSACVRGWATTPAPVTALQRAGLEVHQFRLGLADRARLHWRDRRGQPRPLIYSPRAVRWLDAQRPALVVISQGGNADGVDWMEHCRRRGIPYAAISQHANELEWPPDTVIGPLREGYLHARAVYFVSQHNRRLTETQIGRALPNATVVWNPRGLRTTDSLPWPDDHGGEWKWACVARLEPNHKGQDLLLQVLAQPPWPERPLRVRLFGRGAMEHGLRELAARHAHARVEFAGQGDVEDIWREHHALILPSRAEGLPLALTEAMWCGRPAIVTDAGGNAEPLEEGRTGFIADAPNVRSLAAAMERAWTARASWRTMGEAAAVSIRRQAPADPVAAFCDRLRTLLSC